MVQHGVYTHQPLTFGTAGRNIVKSPWFKNLDFAFMKNTRIAETTNLEFRAEFFNIFNHPNLAMPGNIESRAKTSVAFESQGESAITTAIQEQLGLKLKPQKSPRQILVIDDAEKPLAD